MGLSDISQASIAIITALVPEIPTNVTLKSRSATSFTITWTSPDNTGGVVLTGYHVYVS